MPYLYIKDYLVSIQNTQLVQINQNNDDIRLKCEKAAQEEAISYLTQKYDVNKEFTSTSVWSYNTIYNAMSRVYLNASSYDATATYALHALTLYNNYVYICTTAIASPETWNAAHWQLLGKQYDLFYANYPLNCTNQPTLDSPDAPVFIYEGLYNKGDIVFYKNKTYVCNTTTMLITHEELLQYNVKANVPYYNVAPDDSVNNSAYKYWSVGTIYQVPSGTLPTNTTYWISGDNRSQEMVLFLCDLVLWHLYQAIAPQNIPDLRRHRYNEAKDWLREAARGEVTAQMTRKDPIQGSRIRFGGNIKNNNFYVILFLIYIICS